MSNPRSGISKRTQQLSAHVKRACVRRSKAGRGRREAGGVRRPAENLTPPPCRDQSNDFFLRSAFFVEWRFFDSSRASLDAFVGLVARRFLGTMRARLTRSANLSSASSRFRVWLRMSLATTRMLPSVVSRDDSLPSRRARCSSSSAREPGIFQKISTREEVLLTCWPPAPDDRDTRTSSSLRGIERASLTARRFCERGADGSLTPSAPAEKLERGEEGDDSPDHNDQHLRGNGGERSALQHIGPQRIVHGGQRQDPDERLHHRRKIG